MREGKADGLEATYNKSISVWFLLLYSFVYFSGVGAGLSYLGGSIFCVVWYDIVYK